MEVIATITSLAAATCIFAVIGLLWRIAECADEAIATTVAHRPERTQK
jgi:hypothetical protein